MELIRQDLLSVLKFIINIPFIYVYLLFFINFIKCLCILGYTKQKNKKSIHDMIRILTTMIRPLF